MQTEIHYIFELLDFLMDEIEFHVNNESFERDLITSKQFFQIQLKFERVSELLSYSWNHQDYLAAIEITKSIGYASISEISRKLGIIYIKSVEMIYEMEREGIITKPKDERGYWVYIDDKKN
ncbi:hypothetical protein [Desulfobacter vibrioformis]|uniref:hypothetical protein n=1 Tax=Desulfobacter vibrioformis TaxID=34031 RepID=UPI000553EFFA|nr:hypothetical protein [Desulfobacter vibrioformis]